MRVNPPTCRIPSSGTANAAQARMTRALLVAALLVGTSSVAAAGPYVGLGLGPAPALSSNADAVHEDGRSMRLLGGYRFKSLKIGEISVEGAVTAYDAGWPRFGGGVSVRHFALFGKYSFPLGSGFGVFGRLGVQHTSMETDDGYDYSDNGIAVGTGAEYAIRLPFVSGAVFVDYTVMHVGALTEDPYSLTSRQWMLGFTVGF